MKKLTSVDRKSVLQTLGYEAQLLDPDLLAKLDQIEFTVLDNIKPRYTAKCYNLFNREGKIELVECDMPLPGEKITRELYYCKKAVVFCATLSDQIDPVISKVEESSIEDAVIMDAVCKAALESYCDLVEEDIASRFEDYRMTFRFSDVYGDLPDGVAADLVAIIEAETQIGVKAREKGLTPRFSITAIIGLM